MKRGFLALLVGVTCGISGAAAAETTAPVPAPAAEQAMTPAQAQTLIAQELQQDLLCVKKSEHARADAHKSNEILKAAGARITFDDAEDTYSNYVYRFDTPLTVKGLPVYAVSQTEGENGVIFTAEVKGNPATLAGELKAKPLGENEIVFGLGNELFHRPVGKPGKADAIIIGANDEQKALGRFYFGCSQGAEQAEQ